MPKDSAATNVIPLQRIVMPPSVQGRVDATERWASHNQWGDLRASTLTGVLSAADRGDVAQWYSLSHYAIRSTPHLSSLNATRRDRVVQADWVIKPPKYGDPALGTLAAEFVEEAISMIGGWRQALRDMLHAIGPGYSANEMVWRRNDKRKINFVEKIVHVPGHRFRYDEQWNLRLYDGGRRRSSGSAYGEALDPRRWIVHEHQEVSGYKGATGVMRACIWDGMFARWVEKFNILFLEKYGSPLLFAKVDPNTTESVRNQILEDLQNLSNEHVGVYEGHEIDHIDMSSGRSAESYAADLKRRNDEMTKVWLGASDAVEPGSNGARAAVETRIGATMDPKMKADGASLADTLRVTLFKQLIAMNLHKFGGADIDEIPLPEMRFKTADDEVKTDQSDRSQENAREKGSALTRDQMLSLREILADANGGVISHESAKALITGGLGLSESAALRMLGGLSLASEQAIPKAKAPVAPGLTTATQRTSLRYPSPFKKTRGSE